MTKLFPSIIPDSDTEFVDDSYHRSELEDKDRTELQQLAAEHDADDVHGQMSNEDIIDGLVGKQRIDNE